MSLRLQRVATAVLFSLAGVAQADIVNQWNDVYLLITRLQGGAPCPISRSGPLLNLALYDAVNSIDRVENFEASHKPYLDGLPIPLPGTSKEAAAAAAAYTIMSNIYPMQSDENPQIGVAIQALYDDQLALIADGPAKANGLIFGEAVAFQLLIHRFTDGYDADPSYTLGGNAGDWRITPDGPFVQPFTPHWGNVTPWGLETGDMFRPTRLTDLGTMHDVMISPEYAEQINGSVDVPGVKDLGDRNSTSRTPDQTQAAWFWANDRDGTSKPPGQLIQITQRVSQDMGLTLSQNARLFGLVGLALGDACIAAWDAKYNTPIDLWRPIDAVRETLDDSNPLTTPVPDWLPLNDFTPPFPAYVSGHATFGATHAAIMANFFGTDDITFTIGSDEFEVNPGLGYPANLTRTFTSFSQAGWENAMSRVWLGVHFYWDSLDGYALGYKVGNHIFKHQICPSRLRPCQADMNSDSFVDDPDFVRFADQYNAFDCRLANMPWACAADLNADNYVDDADFVLFAAAYEALLCP